MANTDPGLRHHITVTTDGTRRACICGWSGARTDSHPPMTAADAAATLGPRCGRNWRPGDRCDLPLGHTGYHNARRNA